MKERSYRLAQYEIILESSGGIWWKSHGGFADAKSGRCFIEGNVLFIGPGEVCEPGCLKNEFLEHLRQFPPWERTKYYCPSYTLYRCKGGRVRDGLHRPANTEGVGYDASAEVINHSFSPVAAAGDRERVEKRESGPSPSEGSTRESRGRIALSSLSPTAGIKHMRGTWGKALRRCKGLVGWSSERDESEE